MMVASILAMISAAAATPNGSNQSNSADDHKIVCQMEIVIGSQIKQRICRTKAEWKRINDEAEKEREAAAGMPAHSCDASNPFGHC